MRLPRWTLVGTLGLAAAGCQTPVGNYFANRARDLGECVRIECGVGPGLGGGVNALGLVHLGLGGGWSPTSLGLGWEYGEGFALGYSTAPTTRGAAALWGAFPIGVGGGAAWFVGHTEQYRFDRPNQTPHMCVVGLPCVWPPLEKQGTWDRVHVWDVQASVWLGVVYGSVGFSPGEFLDFLSGWFGADIAGDDRPFSSPAKE